MFGTSDPLDLKAALRSTVFKLQDPEFLESDTENAIRISEGVAAGGICILTYIYMYG